MTNSGGTFYYTSDALGSTITLTDGAQGKAANYVYDFWGNTTATGAQAANNPFQYTGARYFNPTIGRFTQRDPSGQDPHYTYAANNPCNMIDPSGLSTRGCAGAITSFIGGYGGFNVGAIAAASAAIAGTGVGIPIAAAGFGFVMAIGSGITAAEECDD